MKSIGIKTREKVEGRKIGEMVVVVGGGGL
jgi:hypothetical protein